MQEKIPGTGEGAEAPRERKVLLVEDEEIVALALVDELQRLGWSIVGPATTLDEAQRLVSSGTPIDAAILDVNLQGRWSHEIAEALGRRGVPFIACTGYEIVDPDGRFAGVPVITKPIGADRLSATLDDLLAEAEPHHNSIEPSAG